MSDYTFRSLMPDELPSVLEAWAGTFRSSRYAGCIPNDKFYAVTYDAITQLINRGMQITALVLSSRPEQVLAWVAHEQDTKDLTNPQPIVHYLFTKAAFRKRGLSRLLMDHIGAVKGSRFIYTFCTSYAKHFAGGYHMPSLARRALL